LDISNRDITMHSRILRHHGNRKKRQEKAEVDMGRDIKR
jgi:hypothetical protein